jgi:hypothetical protein
VAAATGTAGVKGALGRCGFGARAWIGVATGAATDRGCGAGTGSGARVGMAADTGKGAGAGTGGISMAGPGAAQCPRGGATGMVWPAGAEAAPAT